MSPLRSAIIFASAACFGLLWLSGASATAADDSGEARFIARNLCPVGQMLNAVRAGRWKSKDELDHYLIVYPKGRPGAYAQCAFFDGGLSVHCEIASPFYARWNHPPDIARKPAVARLGYSLDDSKGNYVREFNLDDETSPPLAEFMLRSLYESFLDDPETRVMFDSALAKYPPPHDACAPTS
jgi:hypothetical protein